MWETETLTKVFGEKSCLYRNGKIKRLDKIGKKDIRKIKKKKIILEKHLTHR